MAEQWAAVAETHSGVVFFLGDYAYKVKKPVNLGFLDYTTPQSRELACFREVELNRRLAPDVYLGVADVLGPGGVVCDHLVVMRRMDSDRRFSTLLRTADRRSIEDAARSIARVVASFHGRQPAVVGGDRYASPSAVKALWHTSLDQMAAVTPHYVDLDVLDRTRALVDIYVDGRHSLFNERIRAGKIRDGHGDLLADDIFILDDGPRILDCLEFDDELRISDVLLDVAFLAMDLERLGAPELARMFLRSYAEYAGESHPSSLEHFYVAYRAHVRSKVECVRSSQVGANGSTQAMLLADLSLDHLHAGAVKLVLLGGLPGVGKSTTARALAGELEAVLLNTDVVRKELVGLVPTRHATTDYETGIYTPQMTALTYGELLRRARTALEHGESVVLDASWRNAGFRAAARTVATETSAVLNELVVHAPTSVAMSRLAGRAGPSDATPEVHRRMAAEFDSWPQAIVLNGLSSRPEAVHAAYAAVMPAQTHHVDLLPQMAPD